MTHNKWRTTKAYYKILNNGKKKKKIRYVSRDYYYVKMILMLLFRFFGFFANTSIRRTTDLIDKIAIEGL